MLSEEKIKLMTNTALFEKHEGKKIFPAGHYFKSDYVSGKLLRSFFSYTLSFLLGFALWVLYHIDEWMNTMNLDTLIEKGIRVGIVYGIGLALYLVISFIVYVRIYGYAARGMKVYLAKLKRLDKRYESTARTGGRGKGGRTQ